MVGGGEGAFIGAVHRIAARLAAQANVRFEFVTSAQAAKIRITFKGGVNQSSTGRDALRKQGATMQLPGVARHGNSATSRRIVLHEFGHGLMALGHEHRHPDARFQFKSAREIRDIINATLPAGHKPWTIAMVRINITNAPYARSRVCTSYDVESIMHYPVAQSWLRNSGNAVPSPATTLSRRDRECARAVYS